MADQFWVDLGPAPATKTSSYALWVLSKEELENVVAGSPEWELRRTSNREVKDETFHPTAKARQATPAPLRKFLEKDDRTPERVLYHGCGRDEAGLLALGRDGAEVIGYDPYHPEANRRKEPRGEFDEVFSVYTLNVVDAETGLTLLQDIVKLLKKNGRAIIAVRRDL